jgi:hypothetical protein
VFGSQVFDHLQTRTIGGRALELATDRVQNKAFSGVMPALMSAGALLEDRRRAASEYAAGSLNASAAIGRCYQEDVHRLVNGAREQSNVQKDLRGQFLRESEKVADLRTELSKLLQQDRAAGLAAAE